MRHSAEQYVFGLPVQGCSTDWPQVGQGALIVRPPKLAFVLYPEMTLDGGGWATRTANFRQVVRSERQRIIVSHHVSLASGRHLRDLVAEDSASQGSGVGGRGSDWFPVSLPP